MALTMTSHIEVMQVIDARRTFEPFLLKFFLREYLSPTDTIVWERIPSSKKLAPFVLPDRPGLPTSPVGFQVETFVPAYIKLKDSINFNKPKSRRAGEAIGGSLTQQERYDLAVLDLVLDYDARWLRTLEVMAAQILTTGKCTISGEGYPTTTVDFGRTAALGAAATTLWSNVSATPVEDLQAWILASKRPIRDLIIGADAMKKLRADPLYKEWTDKNYAGNVSVLARGLVDSNKDTQENDYIYWGSVAGQNINLWTYKGTYLDTSGTERLYVPADSVVGIPSGDFGVRCFAAIQDAEAEFMPLPQYFKNWVEKDPGLPFLLMQSAPVLVHTEIDSTFCHKVL